MSRHDPLYLEAITTFRDKFARVAELGMREPGAMSLATVGHDGMPSVRTVLLRGIDERGFTFFTNSTSRKGRQLAGNPQAGLCFYWDQWFEQVHVEGHIERLPDAESDMYFARRPRLSQIGAWASDQSQPLDSRDTLIHRVEALEIEYAGRDVPRPPHWHGFIVVPRRIEFWNGRDGRLHERVVYEAGDTGWTRGALYP